MAEIEWTVRSDWNPLRGCTRKSTGCVNCYAEIMAARFSDPGQWGHGYAERVKDRDGKIDHRWTGKVELLPDRLTIPLRWRKPTTCFASSTSDIFHEKMPFSDIEQIFATIMLARRHTFQVLTKRPDRMAQFMQLLEKAFIAWFRDANPDLLNEHFPACAGAIAHPRGPREWPLPNLAVGTSTENQETAGERVPELLKVPAVCRFLSCEPMLGHIRLAGVSEDGKRRWNWLTGETGTMHPEGPDFDYGARIHWVIVGGESGHGARPLHPDWVRSLRDQCAATDTAFFFKQWGEWGICGGKPSETPGKFAMMARDPGGWTHSNAIELDFYPRQFTQFGSVVLERVGRKASGHLLDGREYHEFPSNIRFPGLNHV